MKWNNINKIFKFEISQWNIFLKFYNIFAFII